MSRGEKKKVLYLNKHKINRLHLLKCLKKKLTLNSHSTMQAKFILVSGSLAHKRLTGNMYLYNV